MNIEITNEATKELYEGQGQIIETRILGIFALVSMVVDHKTVKIWSLFSILRDESDQISFKEWQNLQENNIKANLRTCISHPRTWPNFE